MKRILFKSMNKMNFRFNSDIFFSLLLKNTIDFLFKIDTDMIIQQDSNPIFQDCSY